MRGRQGFLSSAHHEERAIIVVRAEGLAHLLQDPLGPTLKTRAWNE